MRGRLLGLLLISIPMAARGAELAEIHEKEAIALIENARESRAGGYFSRSEAQYRRALGMVERSFGIESPDLIPGLNGLAELYFDMGRYSEAEVLSKRSAALVTAALGPGHPLLATAEQDLAAIYHAQGQYGKAEPLYLHALAIREASLGTNHPFVAVTLSSLAEMERAQSNYERAAVHYAVRSSQLISPVFSMDNGTSPGWLRYTRPW